MDSFNIERSRNYLKAFQFEDLFIDELGWNQAPAGQAGSVDVEGMTYRYQPIAELSGLMVFEVTAEDGQIPYSKKRMAVHREIAQSYHENLLIFVDADRVHSVWYWVKREGGKLYPRTHHYDAWQDPDFHLGKISGLFVAMSELDPEGRIEITRVVQRVQSALDIERVTKRFYGEFQQVHDQFMAYLEPSIPDEKDRRWYTSALLNRLMFIYFLQRQRLIDNGATGYLHDKLQARQWQDRYYLDFLHPLFFEGFALPESKRSDQARAVLGVIPYLNGGLFLRHPVEIKYAGRIQIPDQAFRDLFTLLDGYTWHLDDRPGRDNKEINPDVLGYIFEKYINQKAFGAYYTRPEITEYLCEQTIERLVLEKMHDVDEHDLGVLPPLNYEDVHELLRKMDGQRALILLQDILPKLSLLDPACGSGAFLVAALKTLTAIYQSALGRALLLEHPALRQYLGRELDGHPNHNYYIRKKIISHNLFGVDIMDEAVEIARLRLFLALVATIRQPDDLEPLPNIDFNILPGNSLIGLLRVDEETFNQMTPGETGGKAEQAGMFATMKQGSLLGLMGQHSYRQMVEGKERLVKSYRLASTLTDDVEKLRADIEGHRQKAQATLSQILLNEFGELGIKYEQATWDSKKNKEGKAKKRALKLEDIAALQPFHWGYEFDEVMNTRGGFDAIITNPPWESLEPNVREFFIPHTPDGSKKKLSSRKFNTIMENVLTRDNEVKDAWLKYQSYYPHQRQYFRNSSQYPYQVPIINGRRQGKDINLYKLFLEQCFNLLCKNGECGIVVPSGIYTDLGAKDLRRLLFEHTQITGLFGFENRKAIFEGVHRSFKFVVLTFRKGGVTDSIPAAFMRRDVKDLLQFPEEGALDITVDLIKRLAPDSFSMMEFQSLTDISIVKKMTQFPMLGEYIQDSWNLELHRELNMTDDSDIFHVKPEGNLLPLYEGKMIFQFDHQYQLPRYWVKESQARAKVLRRNEDSGQTLDYQTFHLAYRDVTSNTNERTLIATVLPPNVFTGHTMYVGSNINQEVTLLLVVFMNSYPVDYVIRQKVTSHCSIFYVNQISVPRLTAKDTTFQPIVSRAARLICTTPEFDDLAAEVGLGSHANGVTDPAQRAQLRAELDGLIAHVYGLTEEEFSHILSTFPLVEDEVKEAALNEYRKLAPNPELLSLIASGESATVEFKQAACRNPHTSRNDNNMRNNIVEAVAAFMNSSGGTLLIGIADDGTITGVGVEYATVNASKANWDGYELFLADLLNKSLSVTAAFQYFTITRHTLNGRDIAQVQVKPASEAVYVNNKLYVRVGAQSKELQGPDMISYVNRHWK